jgi:predicted metal-dependent enzyme (double-stranded beta helix superfamily)
MTTTTIHTRSGGPGTAIDHLATARRYAASPQDWPLAPRYDPQRRWYHRLATEPDGEVWMLSWLPGQGTDLHDHGGSAGAFLVISGALTERTLADPQSRSPQFSHRLYDAGQGRSFGCHHIHQIANTGIEPAISLHVYSPALREMTRYHIADGQLVVAAVDRAGADW